MVNLLLILFFRTEFIPIETSFSLFPGLLPGFYLGVCLPAESASFRLLTFREQLEKGNNEVNFEITAFRMMAVHPYFLTFNSQISRRFCHQKRIYITGEVAYKSGREYYSHTISYRGMHVIKMGIGFSLDKKRDYMSFETGVKLWYDEGTAFYIDIITGLKWRLR